MSISVMIIRVRCMEMSSLVTYIGLVWGSVGGVGFLPAPGLDMPLCAVGWLEYFDDVAPCVSQVETIISVKVVWVQSDLDSLPYKAVRVSGTTIASRISRLTNVTRPSYYPSRTSRARLEPYWTTTCKRNCYVTRLSR
jgi:hypothetical protein